MNQITIERILADQGCTAYYKEVVSPGGKGKSTTYVYARRRGFNAKSLGPLPKVLAMDEATLSKLLATRFPAQEATNAS